MTPLILTGTISVTTALILFTIFSIKILKTKTLTRGRITGLVIAVALDLTALVCMSIAATHPPFTLHGLIGYSAFLSMAISVGWSVKAFRAGEKTLVPTHAQYHKYVYMYWVVAYFTGAFMAMG
ncbi:MAG: hypothetical protein ACE5D8_00730 [Fidelibacterota bacterium]